MSLTRNLLTWTVLFVLAGCASPPPVVYKPPQVPPLPPQIAQKQEVNLLDRLTKLLTIEQPSQQSQK